MLPTTILHSLKMALLSTRQDCSTVTSFTMSVLHWDSTCMQIKICNLRSFYVSMLWLALGKQAVMRINSPELRQHSWVELSTSFQSLQRPPPSGYCCSTDRYSDCHQNFHKGHILSPWTHTNKLISLFLISQLCSK